MVAFLAVSRLSLVLPPPARVEPGGAGPSSRRVRNFAAPPSPSTTPPSLCASSDGASAAPHVGGCTRRRAGRRRKHTDAAAANAGARELRVGCRAGAAGARARLNMMAVAAILGAGRREWLRALRLCVVYEEYGSLGAVAVVALIGMKTSISTCCLFTVPLGETAYARLPCHVARYEAPSSVSPLNHSIAVS